MPIYKAKVETEYTVLPNSTLQDKNLSFEARGLLGLLISMPEDWAINKEWLIKQSKAGRDKVQGIINELVNNGYMSKYQPKNQHGKFTSNDYFVYPTPVNGFSVNGSTVNGKSTTTKETSLTKETDNKVNILIDAFEVFWLAGMRKVNKQGAMKSFNKAFKDSGVDDPFYFANGLVNDVKARINSNQFGFDKMHPTTYLNQQRWSDEHETSKPASTNANRKLSAAEENEERLRKLYGNNRVERNEPTCSGVYSSSNAGHVQQPMETQQVTIELGADDWGIVD